VRLFLTVLALGIVGVCALSCQSINHAIVCHVQREAYGSPCE
jgi:hypothetical protein